MTDVFFNLKKKFTFSKKLKLLKKSNFIFVFKKPNKTTKKYVIIFDRSNFLKNPRIGFLMKKKEIKYSHDRNRIKRLIRESFRLHQYILSNIDFIFLPKKEIINLDNYTLKKFLEKLWKNYYQKFQN